MDHRRALWSVQNDQLQEIRRSVRAQDEVTNRVIGHLLNHQRVRHRVLNVRGLDAVAERRTEDLHPEYRITKRTKPRRPMPDDPGTARRVP